MKTTRLAMVGLVFAALVAACGSSDSAGSQPTFCEVASAVKSAADAQQKLFDAVDAPPATAVQLAVEDFAAKFLVLTTTFASATYTSAQDRFQSYIDTNCGFTTTPGT